MPYVCIVGLFFLLSDIFEYFLWSDGVHKFPITQFLHTITQKASFALSSVTKMKHAWRGKQDNIQNYRTNSLHLPHARCSVNCWSILYLADVCPFSSQPFSLCSRENVFAVRSSLVFAADRPRWTSHQIVVRSRCGVVDSRSCDVPTDRHRCFLALSPADESWSEAVADVAVAFASALIAHNCFRSFDFAFYYFLRSFETYAVLQLMNGWNELATELLYQIFQKFI